MCKETSTNGANSNPPLIASIWTSVYHAVPPLKLPGTQLSISFALTGALFLTSIRLVAEQVLVSRFGWPENDVQTKEASSNVASVCHSTLLCAGLITALCTQPYCPNEKLSVAPQWWRELTDSLLQFCTGYMIYDAVVNLILLRWNKGDMLPTLGDDDVLFLVHHIITTTYMTSTRVIGAGHISAMMCMLLGEFTNPLHNAYMMSEVAMSLDCCNGPTSAFLSKWITVSFAALYFFFRAVLCPVFASHITYNLIGTKKGRSHIPLAFNLLWIFMIWAVVLGSMSWIEKCYGILVDFATGGSSSGGEEL